jgi:hypothetical protein
MGLLFFSFFGRVSLYFKIAISINKLDYNFHASNKLSVFFFFVPSTYVYAPKKPKKCAKLNVDRFDLAE